MIRKIYLLTIVLTASLLCGCPVHQWPEQKKDDPAIDVPDPEVGTAKGKIHLRFEPDLWVWEHFYFNTGTGEVREAYPDENVDGNHPGTTEQYRTLFDHGMMRYIVNIYLPDNFASPYAEYEFSRNAADGFDCDVDIELEAGDYDIVVWADLYEDTVSDLFHDASNFLSVRLLVEDYRANSDYRDGYRGIRRVSVEPTPEGEMSEYIEIAMRRPMAKFEFITTDLSEFLDNELRRTLTRAEVDEYTVVFSYTGYLPTEYSAIDDSLVDISTGVSFESSITPLESGEASMGFDYVFINDSESAGVEVKLTVKDKAGEVVASTPSIGVPLRRNHHTILRGEFLSRIASGQIVIDPEYQGDYNIGKN